MLIPSLLCEEGSRNLPICGYLGGHGEMGASAVTGQTEGKKTQSVQREERTMSSSFRYWRERVGDVQRESGVQTLKTRGGTTAGHGGAHR